MKKRIKIITLTIFVCFSLLYLNACKAKKCPDFSQVHDRNKLDKKGLVKKKRVKIPSNPQGY